MSAANTVLTALADPEAVFKVLEQLGKGRTLVLAAAVARVPQDVARAIAEQHGWPEQHRVRAAWLDLQREREQEAKGRPLLVLPEPDPVAVAHAHARAKAVQEREAERFTSPELAVDEPAVVLDEQETVGDPAPESAGNEPDPTYGRIDADIQQHVEDLQPKDIGQRVAMENTLQARREARPAPAAPDPVPDLGPGVADPARAVADPVATVPAPRPAPEPAPEPSPEPELVCRDAAGTERGYQRHYRASEPACPACAAAHSTYTHQQSRKPAGRPAREPLPEPPADLITVPVVTGNPDEATAADAWFAEGMRPHLPSLITSLDEMPGPAPADDDPEPDPEDDDPALARALDRFDALRAAGLTDRAASDLAKAPDGVHQLAPGITLTVALDQPASDPTPEPDPMPEPEAWDGTCDACGWPVKPDYAERTGHRRHAKCLNAPSTTT